MANVIWYLHNMGQMVLNVLILFSTILTSLCLTENVDWQNKISKWSTEVCSSKYSVQSINIFNFFTECSYKLIVFSRNIAKGIAETCSVPLTLKAFHISNQSIEVTDFSEVGDYSSTDENPQNLSNLYVLKYSERSMYKESKFFFRPMSSLKLILFETIIDFEEIVKSRTINKWNPTEYFIILLDFDTNDNIEYILKTLWTERNIINCLIINLSSSRNEIFFYNPFFRLSEQEWGKMETIHVQDDTSIIGFLSNLKFRLTLNLNGYPLSICIRFFKMQLQNMSENSSMLVRERSSAYIGTDGLMLNAMKDYLNFEIKRSKSPALGFVGAKKRSIIQGNALYHSQICPKFCSYTFLIPIDCDAYCFIVPKATRKPNWVLCFEIFDLAGWTFILLLPLTIYVIWSRMNDSAELFTTFAILIGQSQKIPFETPDKILLGTYILMNLILCGAFTGLLYKSYTQISYYPDIDTLEDLANSTIKIQAAHSQNTVKTVFGERSVTSILRNKTLFMKKKSTNKILDDVAYKRDSAMIDRRFYFNERSTPYVDGNGNNKLHLLKECTPEKYISFIITKKSILMERLNQIICRANEGGLPPIWSLSTLSMKSIVMKLYKVSTYKSTNETKFNLKDVQLAFYFLAVGQIFALIVFLVEVGWMYKAIAFKNKIVKIITTFTSFIKMGTL